MRLSGLISVRSRESPWSSRAMAVGAVPDLKEDIDAMSGNERSWVFSLLIWRDDVSRDGGLSGMQSDAFRMDGKK